MAHLDSIDDSKWAEVKYINAYAALMGYLSMAVRWLGMLVVAWSTVVLLGGFVSKLGLLDFWVLTVITFIQAAGIVHGPEVEKALRTIHVSIPGGAKRRGPLGLITMVQFLLFIFVRVVLVLALFVLGPFVIVAVSLWILYLHYSHYSNITDEEDPEMENLTPAFVSMCILIVVQGCVFLYRCIWAAARKKTVHRVANTYGFHGDTKRLIWGYFHETMAGCRRDLSFVEGRNLITYAVELMESKSLNDCDAGVRIMDKLITAADAAGTEELEEQSKRLMLVKQLFRSASSSSHLFKNLLRMLLDHPSRSRKMRQRTARLVSHLTNEICLERFPWGVRCISSLLVASSSNSNHSQKGARTMRGHRELVLQGLRILSELAMDQGSCRVMSHMDGLLYQVMRPLSSDLLHLTDHADILSSQVVDASLQVVCRWLSTAAPGDDDASLRTQILSNQEAMSGMRHIIVCGQCGEEQRVLAMKILALVGSQDDKASTIEMLLGIILTDDSHITTRGRGLALAWEELALLSFQSASNAKIILKRNDGDIVGILSAAVLAQEEDESQQHRIVVVAAAGILEGLCTHYDKDDECFQGLGKAMADLMPKILRKILAPPPHESAPPKEKTAEFVAWDTDIEGQNRNSSTSHAQMGRKKRTRDNKVKVALLSLGVMVYDKLISAEDLATVLAEIASGNDAFSFPRRLGKIVQEHGESGKVADCLTTVKLIGKMAISMMRHQGFYDKQDLRGLVESLSKASKDMLDLDCYTLLSGGENGKTLTSLVEEANKLISIE